VKKESENKGSRGKNANQQYDSSKSTAILMYQVRRQNSWFISKHFFIKSPSLFPNIRLGETNMPWTKTRVKMNNTKTTCRNKLFSMPRKGLHPQNR
jgi:hypothetical protein